MQWKELVALEEEALKARVNQNIQGLVRRSLLPNNRFWWRRGTSYMRNGKICLFTHLNQMRFFIAFFSIMNIYHMTRIPYWGWTDIVEHKNFMFDNIVYEKLSSRQLPYIMQMDAV